MMAISAISACGGSGGGGSGIDTALNDTLGEQLAEDSQPLTPDSDGQDEQAGLPDFSVTDLVTSARNSLGSEFNVTVTIANGGEAPATVPGGWWQVSAEPGSTTDYFHLPISFAPQTSGEGSVLAPGESRVFTATSTLFTNEVDFVLPTTGQYVGQVVVNPDLSARFLNPEDEVVESHEAAELDYTNNLSPQVTFDVDGVVPEGCTPDDFEENDALESATPILLDTRYDMNGCDDLSEVTLVDLTAGNDYELFDHYTDRSSTGTPRPTSWRLSVVEPGGRYLTRNARSGVIVKAEVSGPHYVIATYPEHWLDTQVLGLEVISR